MAKKDARLNYKDLSSELKSKGPARLYLLYGEEDYLREAFISEIKAVCLPGGVDDFSYHRLDGPNIDQRELSEAVNAVPFMTERSLCEVRGFDLNKCRDADAEALESVIADIPDYCTIMFVQASGYEPDWRLKLSKSIKKQGKAVNFTSQGQGQLLPWIRRRFSALGKTAAPDAAMRLIYTSGELMSGLIPEIEKIAAGVSDDIVTVADIDRLAHRMPEARVFDMTDCLANRDYDGAARLLSELLSSGEEPIKTLAMIGMQMRRLYAARLAIDEGLGTAYVNEVCGIKYDFITKKLMSAARGFSLSQLESAVRLCAETDYAMKSSSVDDADLLRELLIRIAV